MLEQEAFMWLLHKCIYVALERKHLCGSNLPPRSKNMLINLSNIQMIS